MAGRGYRNKIPKGWIGESVVVEWLDPAGYVQELMSAVKPCQCVSRGKLSKIEKDYIVLVSGNYPDDEGDPTVDATAITVGCVTLIRKE